MPSFSDSIFLFILALLLFGPKRLPVLARELGKWVGEFRRASNEFKMQMEEELRLSEQADRQKQIAAMEAAAPVAPALAEPEQPQLPALELSETSTEPAATETTAAEPTTPLPIATSGDINLMPPSTGLPTPRTNGNALGGLIESIPEVAVPAETPQPMSEIEEHARENALHGD
jgi:sec-independent protein translocase protein TatB